MSDGRKLRNGKERRHHAVRLPVLIEVQGKRYEGMIQDASPKGLGIRTRVPIENAAAAVRGNVLVKGRDGIPVARRESLVIARVSDKDTYCGMACTEEIDFEKITEESKATRDSIDRDIEVIESELDSIRNRRTTIVMGTLGLVPATLLTTGFIYTSSLKGDHPAQQTSVEFTANPLFWAFAGSLMASAILLFGIFACIERARSINLRKGARLALLDYCNVGPLPVRYRGWAFIHDHAIAFCRQLRPAKGEHDTPKHRCGRIHGINNQSMLNDATRPVRSLADSRRDNVMLGAMATCRHSARMPAVDGSVPCRDVGRLMSECEGLSVPWLRSPIASFSVVATISFSIGYVVVSVICTSAFIKFAASYGAPYQDMVVWALGTAAACAAVWLLFRLVQFRGRPDTQPWMPRVFTVLLIGLACSVMVLLGVFRWEGADSLSFWLSKQLLPAIAYMLTGVWGILAMHLLKYSQDIRNGKHSVRAAYFHVKQIVEHCHAT